MAKAALITGGATRIGRAITEGLAEKDYPVVIHANTSRKEAQKLAEAIQSIGGTAVIVTADLGKTDDTMSLIEKAQEAIGAPLGLLVNNASIFKEDNLETLTPESWQKHQNVNLRAPLLLSQNFARKIKTNKQTGGHIINIIDQRVIHPGPDFLSYTVSKTGLWNLTKILAIALAPDIRVNAIAPGPILKNQYQSEESFSREIQGTPLKKATTLKEFQDAISFLETSKATTGQMIFLDGGQHMIPASQ